MFPDLSLYPDFQQEAIKTARNSGSSSFSSWGITYAVSRDKHGFRIDAEGNSKKAWFVFTDWRGDHYALKVEKEFRSQWVGKLLLTTKQALDWVLQHDWSWVYSRMFFLIKSGYVPLSRIAHVSQPNEDRPLTWQEGRVLLEDLEFYANNQSHLPDWFGVCPFLIRMIYAPRGAQSLLQKIQPEA
jgi:GNAT superfamily N-acetyltransferase